MKLGNGIYFFSWWKGNGLMLAPQKFIYFQLVRYFFFLLVVENTVFIHKRKVGMTFLKVGILTLILV